MLHLLQDYWMLPTVRHHHISTKLMTVAMSLNQYRPLCPLSGCHISYHLIMSVLPDKRLQFWWLDLVIVTTTCHCYQLFLVLSLCPIIKLPSVSSVSMLNWQYIFYTNQCSLLKTFSRCQTENYPVKTFDDLVNCLRVQFAVSAGMFLIWSGLINWGRTNQHRPLLTSPGRKSAWLLILRANSVKLFSDH